MKYFLTVAFFIGCLTAFAQNPLDGTWHGSVETPDGPFEITYVFKIEKNVLTGTLKTQFGEVPVDNGKVDGKNFSFNISFNETTMSNTGTLVSENEILIKNERGELKLARVKP